MVDYFPPPCGVVRSGGGSARGDSPAPPRWHGVGSGFLAVVPPCIIGSALGLLWVFGILIPMMIMMMMMMTMGTMITIIIIIIIINSNILMFLWLVVGCLLPTYLVTIIVLLIVGPLSS